MSASRVSAQACRILCYLAASYLWLGAMFLLMTHEVTPSLWAGAAGTAGFWRLAKRLDPGAFRGRRTDFWAVMAFIGLQVLAWRHFYFFRDPDRSVPPGAAVVAPADGFVVYARPVKAGQTPVAVKKGRPIALTEIIPGAPAEDGWIVGIFMTPLSVHVNRSPVTGVVTSRTYRSGSSLRSMLPMSLRTMFSRPPYEAGSEHLLTNERETLLIEGDLSVYVTRIADSYADKIVTWKKEGDSVEQGERIGLIKMGSQTDLFFPAESGGRPVRIRVKEGQYVYAGETVLAALE